MDRRGAERLGTLDEHAFLAAGAALYAGEGAEARARRFANTDPALLDVLLRWFRHFFEIDERRLRARCTSTRTSISTAATDFWSDRLHPGRSVHQAADRRPRVATPKTSKHQHGCMTSLFVHQDPSGGDGARAGFAIVGRPSGVAQLAERSTVNRFVVGSSPTPGASSRPSPPAGAVARSRGPSRTDFGTPASHYGRGPWPRPRPARRDHVPRRDQTSRPDHASPGTGPPTSDRPGSPVRCSRWAAAERSVRWPARWSGSSPTQGSSARSSGSSSAWSSACCSACSPR